MCHLLYACVAHLWPVVLHPHSGQYHSSLHRRTCYQLQRAQVAPLVRLDQQPLRPLPRSHSHKFLYLSHGNETIFYWAWLVSPMHICRSCSRDISRMQKLFSPPGAGPCCSVDVMMGAPEVRRAGGKASDSYSWVQWHQSMELQRGWEPTYATA